MSTPEPISYETVLNTVRQWPPTRRLTLVQDVLKTLATEMTSTQLRCKILHKALGLLATDRPAPSDAEIQQWLDERRMEV